MASKYWIKLYHKTLDNPQMGRLPDNLWRRFIECCLLAGEFGFEDDDPRNGRLPSIGDISWRLRVDEEVLTQEFDALARHGLLEYRVTNDYWFVTTFNTHQRKMSKAEYMQRLRKERAGVTTKPDTRYQSVTIGNADIDTDIDNTYTHTASPPYDGHAENNNQPIDELKTALAATVKQILGPGVNEQLFDDAAYTLFGYDVTPQQVRDFGTWWEANGYYSGKPAIRSLLADIRNSVNGVSAKPKQKPTKNDKQEKKAILLKQVGKSWKDAEPVLVEAGLLDTVKKMGRWEDLGRMQPTDITIKFFTAYGVTHGR